MGFLSQRDGGLGREPDFGAGEAHAGLVGAAAEDGAAHQLAQRRRFPVAVGEDLMRARRRA